MALDRGFVELIGPGGLQKTLIQLSGNLASLNKGFITFYALYILVGLILYLALPYIFASDTLVLLLILFAFAANQQLANNK